MYEIANYLNAIMHRIQLPAKTDCDEKYGKSLFNGGRIWEYDQQNPNKPCCVFSLFDSSLLYILYFVASS